MSRFHSEDNAPRIPVVLGVRGREPPSKVRQNNAVLERAMTARHGGWEKETGTSSKSEWRGSTMYDNAQCSQDKLKNSVNKSEWKEFSRELHVWASLKEKSHT